MELKYILSYTSYIPIHLYSFLYIPADGKASSIKILESDSEIVKEKKLLTLKWIEALPNCRLNLIITENTGVCEKHFTPDQIIIKKVRKELLKGSIPSIFNRKINKYSINSENTDLEKAINNSLETLKNEKTFNCL